MKGTVDYTAPSVSELAVTPQKARDGVTINVSATVTGASSIFALLYYPNGSYSQNLSLDKNSGTKYWNDSHVIDTTPFGTYNATIWAADSSTNINNNINTWYTPYLNLSDEQTITIDHTFSDWRGGMTSWASRNRDGLRRTRPPRRGR